MKTLLSVFAAIAITSPAFAAKKDEVPNVNLSEVKVGELITGPAVDLANTGGKAVVIEMWGVNCGPCIASLPHIEQLAKRNKADTIFIGAHSQNATDDQVKEVVKKHKLSYTITKGVNVPAAAGSSGIPHALVFDTTGKLIFKGHPSDKDFDSAVRKAGKPAAAGATGGSSLQKK
jgi:thiol-disulfide isomerase/thioredoxin